jgi:glycine/D-amino acid oxidase-like deaminating enzyme
VAALGGGMTGSSAALALAKKGAWVALLEVDTIGNAASGRNGGMCNNGFAQNHAVMAGKDAANALYKAFDASVDMVEVMDNPGRISTGRRSPDISGVPGPCRSSAPTIG